MNHAFMPIVIRVVSKEQYQAWAAAAQDDLDEANKQLMASINDDKKLADAKREDISVAAN